MKRFDVLPNMKERLSELKGLAAASSETRLAVERERLLRGEKPRSMFSNRQQSAAARLLAGFFVMILALTFLSRMAASLTIAEVSTGSARAGVLTQRYFIPGTIEARDTLDITLPGGLRISGVMVQEGDSVDAGDALLKLDTKGLQDAIEQLENEIGIIDMRIASLSLAASSVETEQIRRAEDNLKYAREDYQRLLDALDASDASSVSGRRAEEDLRDAQTRYNDALLALENAKVTAREQLVTAAQKALNDAEYSRAEAVAAAQAAVDSADAAENAADAALDSAVHTLNRAREQLEQADRALRDLWYQDPPASPEEIAAAEAAMTAAEDQVYSAQAQVDAAEAGLSGSDSVHALENLRRVKERHDQLVSEAELALMAAQNKTDMSDEPLVVAAQAVVDSAQAGLKTAERSYEDAGLSQEQQRELAQQAVESAQRAVELAETELASAKKQAENARQSNEVIRRQNESEKLQYSNERKHKQDALDQLRELRAQDGIIAAPEAGTVRMIAETGAVQANDAAVILSQAGENFQFVAKTEKDAVELLAEGDAGTLSFASGGTRRSVKAQISSLGTPDVDGQVRLTVSLTEGGFTDGTAGELELEKNSDRYQTILPISALRVIGVRTVVLVVRETQSVMGTEQTVEEVDVSVKDQDTENMAVEATLFPDDKVVVRSSKPIGKGDRVRAAT